jgi:hypothetical protein
MEPPQNVKEVSTGPDGLDRPIEFTISNAVWRGEKLGYRVSIGERA